MIRKKQQKGMSMWSMLGLAMIGAFVLLIIIKLVPAYTDNMKVKAALESLASQPNAASMSNAEVMHALDRRFQIEDIDGKINLKDALRLEKEGKARVVTIAYDSITPIFGNIFVLIEFSHSAEVGTFAE